MNNEQIREYCLQKKGVTESLPFGPDVLVFKVLDKMFALINLEGEQRISLKCDPDYAIELRERYPAVIPGYHMNKKLWNTVIIDGSVPDKLIYEWIDDSYKLIVESLPKKKQQELND